MSELKREEKDAFFGPNHTTQYYITRLPRICCLDDLIDLAKELVQMKHANQSLSSEDLIQQEIFRWDGSELYYLSKGDWGFERIQIDPSNGYVDWGHGWVED